MLVAAGRTLLEQDLGVLGTELWSVVRSDELVMRLVDTRLELHVWESARPRVLTAWATGRFPEDLDTVAYDLVMSEPPLSESLLLAVNDALVDAPSSVSWERQAVVRELRRRLQVVRARQQDDPEALVQLPPQVLMDESAGQQNVQDMVQVGAWLLGQMPDDPMAWELLGKVWPSDDSSPGEAPSLASLVTAAKQALQPVS